MEVHRLQGGGHPWSSFIQRRTSTEVRTTVKKSSPATMSEAVRIEIAAQTIETARAMETVQQQENIEKLEKLTKRPQRMVQADTTKTLKAQDQKTRGQPAE